jgi:hypothetical protein
MPRLLVTTTRLDLVRRCFSVFLYEDNYVCIGKFTRLQFDTVNVLAGSKCVTYLLEKVSRSVRRLLQKMLPVCGV